MAFFTDATKLQLNKLISVWVYMDTLGEARLSTVNNLLWQTLRELVKAETGLSIDNLDWPQAREFIDEIDELESLLADMVHDQITKLRGDLETVRHWNSGDFTLELFDLNQWMAPNHHRMGYIFYHKNQVVFWTTELGCPRTQCVDSDETLANAIHWCSLRPGDTDREYFDNYTPAQLEFVEEFGEELSMIVFDMENPNGITL